MSYRVSQSRQYEDHYLGLLERQSFMCLNALYGLFPSSNCRKKLPQPLVNKYDIDELDGYLQHRCCRNTSLLCHPCNKVKERLQSNADVIQRLCPCCGQIRPFNLLPERAMSIIDQLQQTSTCLCVCVGQRARERASVPVPVPDKVSMHALTIENNLAYEKEKVKRTRTRSEIVHDINSPRYKTWFTLRALLEYRDTFEDVTSHYCYQLNVPLGTIKNAYLPPLTEGRGSPFKGEITGFFRDVDAEPLTFQERKILAVMDFIAANPGNDLLDKLKESDHWQTTRELAEKTDKLTEDIVLQYLGSPLLGRQIQERNRTGRSEGSA